MSDRIHFGTLKLQDRDKISSTSRHTSSNIQTSVLSDSAQQNLAQRAAVIQQIEKNRIARTIAVPTKDTHVKLRLRELGEPICLFGEGPSNRRQRLRNLMVSIGETNGTPTILRGLDIEDEPEIQQETFMTEGSEALKEARIEITHYSLKKAKERVNKERKLYVYMKDKAEDLSIGKITENELKKDSILQDVMKTIEEEDILKNNLKSFINTSSEIGDVRALSSCKFQPSNNPLIIATGSWTGTCKLWNINTSKETFVYTGHSDRVTDVCFHPNSGNSQSPSSLNLVSCSADCSIKLWSLESIKPIVTLNGHPRKINQINFHPCGNYLASCSFDHTWRLWDLERNENILIQEGHAHPITTICFHPDGSLLASSGTDGITRVWDIRSGRSIITLRGHVKPIISSVFSPNGYHLATGSDDHSIRIWDIRKRKCIHTIPAHTKLITSLKYQSTDGNFLVSASLDKTCKIWDTSTFTPLRTLAGHEEKVMSVDISKDSSYILSSGYDRTWKLWSAEI